MPIDKVMLPCKHGEFAEDAHDLPVWPDCPGGRIVEIDFYKYLAAIRDLARSWWELDEDERHERAEEVLATALGVDSE